MRLYLRVTEDKYELPIAVADSPKELAEMLGISASGIRATLHYARHKGRESVYKEVDVDDID